MLKNQRIRKVIKWLIFSGFGENEKDIAELLGYTKSSFSQIMNEKVPLSDRFLDKIQELEPNINREWIETGKGNMIEIYANNGNNNRLNSGAKINIGKNNEKIETLKNNLTECKAQLKEYKALLNEKDTTVKALMEQQTKLIEQHGKLIKQKQCLYLISLVYVMLLIMFVL